MAQRAVFVVAYSSLILQRRIDWSKPGMYSRYENLRRSLATTLSRSNFLGHPSEPTPQSSAFWSLLTASKRLSQSSQRPLLPSDAVVLTSSGDLVEWNSYLPTDSTGARAMATALSRSRRFQLSVLSPSSGRVAVIDQKTGKMMLRMSAHLDTVFWTLLL